MVSTTLPGPWRAQASSDELRRRCIEPDFDDADWLPVTVPGHWATEPSLQARTAVLYRTTFSTDDVGVEHQNLRHWLIFDGIWSSADVWLDGRYLGPTDTWFTLDEFEITEQINERADHVLVVEVMSPRRSPDEPARTLTGIFDDTTIVGHENTGGIWLPVRVISTGPVRSTKNRVICSDANEERATVHVRTHAVAEEPCDVTITTTLQPPGGAPPLSFKRDHHLASGATVLEWDVEVPDPLLWWPWSLGSQPLYRVTVSVEIEGSISSLWERSIGLRKIAMKNWVLSVNGERLFAKGADVWPSSSLPATASAASIERDVTLARELGLDLLRVESHVGRPELYEAADRLGMLVWQDLPMRGEVKRSIRPRAVDAAHRLVDRLGTHACIAIWCAHYDPTGTTTGPAAKTTLPSRRALFSVAKQQTPTWTKSVLDRLVGLAFNRADGSRPVIHGSGTWPSPPRFDGTDTHLRFGWNNGTGRDLENFARRLPRMVRWVSSLGGQSVPDSDGIRDHMWPVDLGLLADQYGLNERAFRQYLPPVGFDNIDAWIDASQAYQGILLRRQIETLRRLKYRPTGGFTFAALADCRPAVSFAIYDHDRNPKQAVAAVRAACTPLIVVADRLPSEIAMGEPLLLDVHVVSDLREGLNGLEVRAELDWPGGHHEWAWRGAVKADDVARIGSINWVAPATPGSVSLRLVLYRDGIEVADNHYRASISRH